MSVCAYEKQSRCCEAFATGGRGAAWTDPGHPSLSPITACQTSDAVTHPSHHKNGSCDQIIHNKWVFHIMSSELKTQNSQTNITKTCLYYKYYKTLTLTSDWMRHTWNFVKYSVETHLWSTWLHFTLMNKVKLCSVSVLLKEVQWNPAWWTTLRVNYHRTRHISLSEKIERALFLCQIQLDL